MLPTVYAPSSAPITLELRAAALKDLDPDAIITGAAAARLTWWPQLATDILSATRPGSLVAVPGFRWEQRDIPRDLVVDRGGLTLANAALSVLDLISDKGGNAIDEALRRKACTLPDLWAAFELTRGRAGNGLRRALLHDSRDLPWSEAERHLHQHYRACALPFAHATNFWVTLSDGRRTPLDFALPDLRLGFEADGFAWHGDRKAFEYDRDRDSDLAAQGWWVIRFSASFLEHEATEVRRRITAIVRDRARSLGVPCPTAPAGGR